MYCQYCGTPLYSPATALENARGQVVHCWFERDGVKQCFDMLMHRFEQHTDFTNLYTDDGLFMSVPNETIIDMEASLRDFDRDAWSEHFNDWRANG